MKLFKLLSVLVRIERRLHRLIPRLLDLPTRMDHFADELEHLHDRVGHLNASLLTMRAASDSSVFLLLRRYPDMAGQTVWVINGAYDTHDEADRAAEAYRTAYGAAVYRVLEVPSHRHV